MQLVIMQENFLYHLSQTKASSLAPVPCIMCFYLIFTKNIGQCLLKVSGLEKKHLA